MPVLAVDIAVFLHIAVAVIAMLAMLMFTVWLALHVGIWAEALIVGKPVSLATMIGMQLRKTNPKLLVRTAIRAHKAALGLSVRDLETHKLNGGRPDAVVDAMIHGSKAGIDVPFDRLSEIDLAGYDVCKMMATAVENEIAADEFALDYLEAINAPRWDTPSREAPK